MYIACQNGMPTMHVNWPCGFLDGFDHHLGVWVRPVVVLGMKEYARGLFHC